MRKKTASASTQQWPAGFIEADRTMFTRHRIPAELVKEGRIQRVTDQQARRDWRIVAPAACNLSGLVFPYPSPDDESAVITSRVRRDKPDVIEGKTKNKYMNEKAGPRCLYRPPGARERLNSRDTVIVLVEAEKSALALTAWAEREERNILTLATGGCWGWSHDKAPISDLEVCRGRKVYILLDANVATNPDVQKARTALAAALRHIGCDVLIANMPQIEDVNGPDDLMVLPEGATLLADVLATAATAVVAPHSEDALATRFAEQQKDGLRYVKQWDKWLVWDGQRWKPDVTDQALSHAAAMLELVASKECRKDSEAKRVRSAKTIREVLRLAGIHNRLAATADQWDKEPWLLNTPGGVVNLRTGELRDAKREDYCTKMTAIAPNEESPRRWLRFLKEITNGNRELQEYLQRVCGYCLTGSTREEALIFLYGKGKNGKSKFVGAISGLLGDYARTASMDSFIVSHNASHPTDLAGLQGARLVTASETTEGRRWDEAKLKNITGGDRITARFMRQDFFDYTPQFKLLLHGNHKPGLRGADEAIHRRLHLVPFNANIPPEKQDTQLAEKLRDEWGGILQWMIEGCLLWQKEGLRRPKAVKDATDEYLASQDVLGRWLAEATELDPNSRVQPGTLYQSFSQWSVRAGEKYTYSQKEFSQRMAERGYESKKSDGIRTIQGLKLTGSDRVRFPIDPHSKNKTTPNINSVNRRPGPTRPCGTQAGRTRKFAEGSSIVN